MLNTALDIIKGVRDGQIGVIEAIKIGDCVVSALTGLSGADSVTITERSVQAGFVVTEGVIDDPKDREFVILLADPEISLEAGLSAALTGSLAGITEGWRDKKETLYSHFRNHEIVTAISHVEVLPNMIIRSIDPMYDPEENWDCFIARVELHQWNQGSLTAAGDVSNAITAASVQVGAL
jgi:hypothetical protein